MNHHLKKRKDNWFSLKLDIQKLDIDKFKLVPTDLHKLKSDVAKLDLDKLEAALTHLKEITDTADKDAVQNNVW